MGLCILQCIQLVNLKILFIYYACIVYFCTFSACPKEQLSKKYEAKINEVKQKMEYQIQAVSDMSHHIFPPYNNTNKNLTFFILVVWWGSVWWVRFYYYLVVRPYYVVRAARVVFVVFVSQKYFFFDDIISCLSIYQMHDAFHIHIIK